jgi:ElaB/YqjD/DUF883 family membrane-anchored ribosome-binding protein
MVNDQTGGFETQTTTSAAKNEAAGLASEAKGSAQQVGGVAKDQASRVASEVGHQAKGMLHQVTGELRSQASTQQQRATSGLQTVSQQLNSMADGADSGVASTAVREVANRVDSVAGWLQNREPADLLEDVKSFARRKPGLFIGIAAAAGFVAGRLTRALVSNAHDDSGRSGYTGGTTTVDYGYGSTTGSGYASGAGLAGGYTGGTYSDAPVGSATAPFVAPAGDPVVDEALGYDELGTDINGTPRGDAGGRL